MRLYLLKLKDRPLYFAAKLARAMLSDLEHLLRPGNGKKRPFRYYLRERGLSQPNRLKHDIPPYSRAVRHLENIAAYLEKIHSDTRLHSAQHDEYIRYSFLLLHEALELIYKDLTALRKRPVSRDIKTIAALAGKNLRLARRRAAPDEADFIENLKFDSIYGSLDRCFDCVGAYFDELAGIS